MAAFESILFSFVLPFLRLAEIRSCSRACNSKNRHKEKTDNSEALYLSHPHHVHSELTRHSESFNTTGVACAGHSLVGIICSQHWGTDTTYRLRQSLLTVQTDLHFKRRHTVVSKLVTECHEASSLWFQGVSRQPMRNTGHFYCLLFQTVEQERFSNYDINARN